MSVNELHDFVAARWRRSVPSSQADVVKALHLNVRQVVRRLVEEAQMEVRSQNNSSCSRLSAAW